jgi:uncharacterized radical SAM superfamily protein
MIPVTDGEELKAMAKGLSERCAKGFLLSGGCDAEGHVPLAPFLAAVREVKRSTPLLVNLHTGLLDLPEEAERLVASGADALSVDIVQDPDVIRQVLHLGRGPEDYHRTLDLLFSCGAERVVPHLCIGMSGPSMQGEERALRLISRFPVSALVLLSFLPARGTPMATVETATPDHVLRIARLALDEVSAPVLLGCMRPRGEWELEAELIRSGVAGVAMPSARTVRWAEENGLQIEWRQECCALQR